MKLGGTAATNVTVVNSTSITATTAAHAAGAVNVVVTNTDAQSGTLTNGYTYTNPAPTVTSITPNSGTSQRRDRRDHHRYRFPGRRHSEAGRNCRHQRDGGEQHVDHRHHLRTCAGAVNVVVTNTDAQSGSRGQWLYLHFQPGTHHSARTIQVRSR